MPQEERVISYFPPNKSSNLDTNSVTAIDIKFNCTITQLPTMHLEAEPVNGLPDLCPATGALTFTPSIVGGNTIHIAIGAGQLRNNNLVILNIEPPILGTDQYGNQFIENDPIDYFFTTTYTPMYSSLRKVRLEAGSFISDLDDDTVNLAIFEASYAADRLTWKIPDASQIQFYNWARTEWTTCKAAQTLIQNVIGVGGLRSKKLDNLEVQYEQKRAEQLIDKINKCLERWEKELNTGGKGVQKPVGFVKGSWDFEEPHVGRMWEKGPYVLRTAGSNMRYRGGIARRYIQGWMRRIY